MEVKEKAEQLTEWKIHFYVNYNFSIRALCLFLSISQVSELKDSCGFSANFYITVRIVIVKC